MFFFFSSQQHQSILLFGLALLLWGATDIIHWERIARNCCIVCVCIEQRFVDRSWLYIFLFLFVSYMRCPLAGGSEWRMAPGPLASSRVSTPKLLLLLTLPNFFLFLWIPFDSFTPLYLLVSYDDDDQISFSNRICGDGGSNHLRWLWEPSLSKVAKVFLTNPRAR